MYYKITNTESKVYKELYALRQEELLIERENRKAVENVVGCDWDNYRGRAGQQHFWRVTQYVGFVFNHPDRLPAKTWRQVKDTPDIYVPDTRTKNGKQIKKFLDELPHSSIQKVFSILGCRLEGGFIFPYVEIGCDDVIVLYMSDRFDETLSKNKDIIEITFKEFKEILGDRKEEG